MPKFKIPVTWSMGGYVEVEAQTLTEAVVDFDPADYNLANVEDTEYVDGSFAQAMNDIEAIGELQGEDENGVDFGYVGCDYYGCDKPYAKTFNAHTSPWCPKWVTGDYCEECFNKVEQQYKEERELNEASANPPKDNA